MARRQPDSLAHVACTQPLVRGLVREHDNDAISFASGASAVDRFPAVLFRDLFNQVLAEEPGATHPVM